jgi:hypothetical protein
VDSIKERYTMETLVQLLITCEILLRKVGEIFWADKINHILKKGNANLNLYLIEEIISWYGGMGSFNDLIVSVYNDHSVAAEDEDKINEELSALRSKIYQEAIHLRRQ